MRLLPALLVALLLSSAAVLLADDHSVVFDEDVNFSVFKTFSIGETRMTSDRPELNFPAVMKTVSDAVRATLKAKGLKETPATGDLAVTFNATGVDYAIGPFGRPNAIRPGERGRRGGGAMAVDFTEVTLVIDLTGGTPAALVWRGVYHDTEKEARKLAEALPKDATVLLAAFPPTKGK